MNVIPFERQLSADSVAIVSSFSERFGSASNTFITDALSAIKSAFEAGEIAEEEKAAMKIELQRGEGYSEDVLNKLHPSRQLALMKEANKRTSLMKQKEQEKIECPVCKEVFNDHNVKPRVLPPCGHTVCETCLRQIIRFPVSRRLCPLDKCRISADISSFPPNFALLEVFSHSSQPLLIIKFQRTFPNGDVYDGDWLDGKMNGSGKLCYANGAVYEGSFAQGKRHGRGKATSCKGGCYEGYWADNKKHGTGKQVFANGTVYDGEWIVGERNGLGVETLSDGTVYEGEWISNKRDGRGICTYADGSIYDGEWKNNKENGEGTLLTSSHKIICEGIFTNGKFQSGPPFLRGAAVELSYKYYRYYGGTEGPLKPRDIGKVVNYNGSVYEVEYQGKLGHYSAGALKEVFSRRSGNALRFGDGSFSSTVYCRKIPFGGVQCGPYEGPQCSDCKAIQQCRISYDAFSYRVLLGSEM